MDWITQAALGATLGELMLGKRLGKRAMAWGALFGIAPNVDILLSLFFDTGHQLAFRRGPTHSLWLMALAAFGLGHWLAKRWKREKIGKAQAGGFVFTLLCGQVLLKCFTVEGASIFWPFSRSPVTFHHLDRGDWLFSLLLVVTAIWLAILPPLNVQKSCGKKPPPPSKRRRVCHWGLGLAAGYALLSVGLKTVASAGFEADLKRRQTTWQRKMVAPTRHNIFLWRAVVDRGGEFWVGYRTVFEGPATPVRWTVYLQGKESLAGVAQNREIKTLMRITDGWWLARPHAKGAWLGDLRHSESRSWGDKKGMVDSRMVHSWLFNPTAKGGRLRLIDESGRNRSDYLKRMTARATGKREPWEANPRLAGVPGSLPEFLPVEE